MTDTPPAPDRSLEALARLGQAFLDEEASCVEWRWSSPRQPEVFARHVHARADGRPVAPRDRRPHSRACGWKSHPHGTQCSDNCPTCHGTEE